MFSDKKVLKCMMISSETSYNKQMYPVLQFLLTLHNQDMTAFTVADLAFFAMVVVKEAS